MKRKILVFLVLACVLMTASTAMAKTVSITFRDLFSGPDSDLMDEMVAKFNELHPHIHVERQLTTWDNYYDQLQLAIGSGQAPDLAVVHTRWLPAFAARNALVPLNEYVQKAGLSSEAFIEAAWNGGFYKDVQYGIPLDIIVSVVLFYNEDLMAQAGIENPPTNMEEFISYAQQIQEKTDAWGVILPGGYAAYRNFFSTLYQAGASVVNEEGTAANFNNDAGRAALQFWVDLYHKYQVAPLDVTQPLEAFRLGRGGFYVDGVFNSPGLDAQEDLNYGVTTIPAFFNNNRSFFANSHNFVIPRQRRLDPEKVEAAMEFVNWMVRNTHNWSAVPSLIEVTETEEVLNSARGQVLEQLPDLVYPPALIDIGRVETAIQEAMEAALQGDIDVATALERAEAEVNSILGR
jgi:multiple sugar transport system substrate-binding protein